MSGWTSWRGATNYGIFLKEYTSYCTLVLYMAPDSQLRSTFLLMKEHFEAVITLGKSANCATGAAKLALPQPPPAIPGSFSQPA